MYVVGFFIGHNSSACILKDGEIIAAVSEERFNRVKNTNDFPRKSIDFCLREAKIKPSEVDLFIRGFEQVERYITHDGNAKVSFVAPALGHTALLFKNINYFWPKLGFFLRGLYNALYRYVITPILQRQFKDQFAQYFGINRNQIMFANHHLCHGYAGLFGFVSIKRLLQNHLIITHDGEGDGLCGTVNVYRNKQWKQISKSIASNSLAKLYETTTSWLGMQPLEDEYKVMGLAPYANKEAVAKNGHKLDNLFWINKDLSIHAKFPTGSLEVFFNRILRRIRFDIIAGVIQKYVENKTCELIEHSVNATGIHNIVVGGGLFMNVKVNQAISKLRKVKTLTICPSAGDESVIFGAAYFGYQVLCNQKKVLFKPKPLLNLYLGPAYSMIDIEKNVRQELRSTHFSISHIKEIELKIAQLLASGNIVARFNGKMEWGARALGNRSLLMDPSKIELKQILNRQIKARDFWMPFAATILDVDFDRYLISSNKVSALYMTVAFDTKVQSRQDLAAAIHPYDFTCRAQLITEVINPSYYKLIQYFKKFTGIGALLNTSFNLHGEPIVCSPTDAIRTFRQSSIQHLAIGDFLISKSLT